MTDRGARQKLDPFQATQLLLEESRMVLPGVQALFGFQLTAVFSEGFSEKLSESQQQLHLVAITLIVLAVIFIMAPAAYHRQSSPQEASEHFLKLATRLMMAGMVPLTLGLSIDVYLLAAVILDSPLAIVLALSVLVTFVLVWFVLPRRWGRRGNA